MLLRNGAERVADFDDLESGEPNFLAYLGLRVKKVNGDLLPCHIVGDSSLDYVFGTALSVGHDTTV